MADNSQNVSINMNNSSSPTYEGLVEFLLKWIKASQEDRAYENGKIDGQGFRLDNHAMRIESLELSLNELKSILTQNQ